MNRNILHSYEQASRSEASERRRTDAWAPKVGHRFWLLRRLVTPDKDEDEDRTVRSRNRSYDAQSVDSPVYPDPGCTVELLVRN